VEVQKQRTFSMHERRAVTRNLSASRAPRGVTYEVADHAGRRVDQREQRPFIPERRITKQESGRVEGFEAEKSLRFRRTGFLGRFRKSKPRRSPIGIKTSLPEGRAMFLTETKKRN